MSSNAVKRLSFALSTAVKNLSLKHYLGTLKPLPLFVYRFLILYFSLSASALLAPQLSFVALSLNNDYVEIPLSVEASYLSQLD